MKAVTVTPTGVILGLVPRTQLSTCTAVAGMREWQHRLQFSPLASAAPWVLGTSPRMTFERAGRLCPPHGATP